MCDDKVRQGQYKCEMCEGVFDFGWSEEEAKTEAVVNGLEVENCGIVCDDCYKQTPWGMADVKERADEFNDL